jgi:hypothetical protein
MARTPRENVFLKMSSTGSLGIFTASRLNPIPGPAELGRAHGWQLAPPCCHPSIAKAALSIARAATAEIACFSMKSANFQANFFSFFNGLL